MPYLQILSGSRDGTIIQLHESGTMVLGCDKEKAMIHVPDSGIEPHHCEFYPGKGRYWVASRAEKTIHDMLSLPVDSVNELKDKTMLIVGAGTFIKYHDKLPSDMIYIELAKIREELADLHESVEDVERLLEKRLPGEAAE